MSAGCIAGAGHQMKQVPPVMFSLETRPFGPKTTLLSLMFTGMGWCLSGRPAVTDNALSGRRVAAQCIQAVEVNTRQTPSAPSCVPASDDTSRLDAWESQLV